MNLEAIKKIIDSEFEDSYKERLVIAELAKDDNVIPLILQILGAERDSKENLIRESNAELSRSLVTLMDDKFASKGQIVDRHWVAGEIKKHYLKWQEFVRCNFKIDGLP